MIKGCDISHYQAGWKPSGHDTFVFIKATEGKSNVDPAVSSHAAVARKAGLVVGFYHYLWPGNPKSQAAHFVQHAPARPGDLLVCDWESAGGGHATIGDKNAFLAEVKRLRPDHKVGLYVNRSMWNGSDKHAADFLWIAAYTAHSGISERWRFWQYADHPIDQNWADFPTRQALADWAGGTPTPPVPPPTPGPKPYEEGWEPPTPWTFFLDRQDIGVVQSTSVWLIQHALGLKPYDGAYTVPLRDAVQVWQKDVAKDNPALCDGILGPRDAALLFGPHVTVKASSA